MSSKEDYFRRKKQLVNTVETLEQMFKVVDTYKVLISKKTEGSVAAIALQEAPFANTTFYLKKWFRTFVGIKDEAMLLINGELIRNYHFKVHENFVHTREEEQHYYTSKAELLGLSSCCVDGLNYEIRMLEKAYRKLMRGDEGDNINMLGDRVRDVEISVDALCKYVDSYAGVLQKELKKRADHVSSAIIEIKHKSENLTVHFKQNLTTCANFVFTCQEARKGSRKEALYSAIEEPKNSVSTQQHSDPAASGSRTNHFRARMVVTDAADEEYQQEALRQKQAKQEEERRHAELEAAKGPDFGFEFSIDQEKRHAGAFELLALPVDSRDTAEDDQSAAVGGSRSATPMPSSAPANSTTIATLQTALANPELDVLREGSVLKVKVVANNAATLSADPSQLCKSKLPGTSVIVFSNPVSKNVVQLYTSVALTSPLNFAELKGTAVGVLPSVGVPAEEVLEEVCRQLWLGLPFVSRAERSATTGARDCSAFMCIPVSLSVNATKYAAGEVVPLPSPKDLAEKRYLVKIDDRSTTAVFTNSIAKWLSSFDEDEAFVQVKRQLFHLRPLIRCICDCLHDSSVPLDLGPLSHVASAAAAPVPVHHLLLRGELQVRQSFFEKLLELASARAGRGLHISARSPNWSGSFSALLSCASHLDVSGTCGLSAFILAEFVASVERELSDSSGGSRTCGLFPHVQILDLQHNRLLNYVDHPWELQLSAFDAAATVELPETEGRAQEPDSEPMDLDAPFEDFGASGALSAATTAPGCPRADLFGRFLLCIFQQCPNLRVLDLSHCVQSEKQATVLCRGLTEALRARDQAGLTPLDTVATRGLELYPASVRELRAQLRNSAVPGAPGVAHFVGVINLHTGGHSFVI